ncbi:hypothetical protein HQ587_02460 [bacterium]|nr:hypothetical protein [bacterium]
MSANRFHLLFLGVLLLLMLFAFHHPKMFDDAFVSFRYAQNLVNGQGLVYNAGERVEGYSNFLWVMLMAAGLSMGVLPEHFSIWLSAPIYLACLILTYQIALKIIKNRTLALIAMILTGTNWTVASFSASGLETPLQLLEFLATVYILILGSEKGWNFRRSLSLSLILNLALLTRPDGVVLVAAGLFIYFKSSENIKPGNIAATLIPFILVIPLYAAWKVSYYGSVLPNPFHAKVHGLSGIPYGFFYLYLFLMCYLLIPYIIFPVIHWRSLIRIDKATGILGICVLSWTAYVILVGGDFMEFRFFVPVIPLLMILLIRQIVTSIPGKTLRYSLIAGLFLGTINNNIVFGGLVGGWGVQSVKTLSGALDGPKENWIGLGKELRKLFGDSDVIICLGQAGVIPYYSGLRSVDMMGMNDSEIPRIGNKLSIMAGHRLIAPFSYICDKQVNLILLPNNFTFDEATFRSCVSQLKWKDLCRYYLNPDELVHGRMIDEAILLGIPYDENLITVAWYLTPHQAIEKVIRERNLYRMRLIRPVFRRTGLP